MNYLSQSYIICQNPNRKQLVRVIEVVSFCKYLRSLYSSIIISNQQKMAQDPKVGIAESYYFLGLKTKRGQTLLVPREGTDMPREAVAFSVETQLMRALRELGITSLLSTACCHLSEFLLVPPIG